MRPSRPTGDRGAILVLVLVVVVILAGAIAAVAAFAFTGPRAGDAQTRHDRAVSALGNAVQGAIENLRTGADCADLDVSAADGPSAPDEPVSASGHDPIDVRVTCAAAGRTFRLCGTQSDSPRPELSVLVSVRDRVVDVTSWQLVDDCEKAAP